MASAGSADGATAGFRGGKPPKAVSSGALTVDKPKKKRGISREVAALLGDQQQLDILPPVVRGRAWHRAFVAHGRARVPGVR